MWAWFMLYSLRNLSRDITEEHNLTWQTDTNRYIYLDRYIYRQIHFFMFLVEVTSLSVIDRQLFFWEAWNILGGV